MYKEVKTEIKTTNKKGIDLVNYEKIVEKMITMTHEISTMGGKEISSNLLSSQEEILNEFPLMEVRKEEIPALRENHIPGIIIKENDKYYYAKIRRKMRFISDGYFVGKHMCASSASDSCCARLSAASDEEGGCRKVRDIHKRIEKYPWISRGYQTFNTVQDAFAVLECSHYKKCEVRPKIPYKDLVEIKISLADEALGGIDTVEDYRRRVSKHMHINPD